MSDCTHGPPTPCAKCRDEEFDSIMAKLFGVYGNKVLCRNGVAVDPGEVWLVRALTRDARARAVEENQLAIEIEERDFDDYPS